ncbi:hypothetical protein [Caryophanon latum]|uniref:Uncharacterized protein n=1 Tax=Caryophanon latum TaxID=33977 RepID=A0A1C0YV84_9BACL|nr:hypothetical protein [Caryophanon latum]OCS91071.1 hypothetical protein A6K76_10020 [Caryophanon latum]
MKHLPLITEELSLYAHSNALIDEFNELLVRHMNMLPLYESIDHTQVDYVAAVFNCWVQLIHSCEVRIAKVNRVIFHDVTIALNQIVYQHEFVHEFKARFRSPDELLILAHCITSEVLLVIQNIIPEYLKTPYYSDTFNEPYYALTNNDLNRPDLQLFTDFRQEVSSKLSSMSMRRHLNVAIYEATKKTRQILAKQQSC